MVDNKGDTTSKKHIQQLSSSSSLKDPQLEEDDDQKEPHEIVTPPSQLHHHHHHHHQHQPPSSLAVVVAGAPFISTTTPLYIPTISTTQTFDQQFENPKRQRLISTTSQWKPLPAPIPSQQKNPQMTESTPSAAASSSDTASSPSQSPIPSLSTSRQEGDGTSQHQFRKGKYVSPVWKPNEMLWLARAWKAQYQRGSGSSSSSKGQDQIDHQTTTTSTTATTTRGKSRADKDREVAEFLNKHGINRDAKTAGTKWDNMLGEFRKVFEWETGSEREQVGKNYFRLSPYERKLHRLPASFDEQVFEELSNFMGPRLRNSSTTSHGSRGLLMIGGPHIDDSKTPHNTTGLKSLPPPLPFKDDDFSLLPSGRSKQMYITSGGMLGYEGGVEMGGSSSSSSLRRIGKIRMTWEELVSLWAEEGDQNHRGGRVRLQGSSFLNADELTFLDDSMVASTMESFEDGSLKGFSVDKFFPGQQVKVFGRKISNSPTSSVSPLECQDPSEYYLGCLRVPPTTLTSLYELSWYIQDPPLEELRFPLRKDVYRDLPQGKELFFTPSNELLDCRAITYDLLSPILRSNPSVTATSRDSFIGVWDDCINRVISKFCSVEMVIIRKPDSSSSTELLLQDQWPNVTGFIRNFCLWRGEETDQVKEGQLDPAGSIAEKLLWTYMDIPYILGYYAVGFLVTFCALSRSQDRITRTDLYSLDLSSSTERLKALIPCYRIASLLPLLADRCFNMSNAVLGNNNPGLLPYSDFERIDLGNGNIIEMSPNSVTRHFPSLRKWAAVKEIYDSLDQRIPHSEFISKSSEKDLTIVFKPRGVKLKPANCEQLIEALKYVTKSLVALHDLFFMHRDLSWEKVMRRSDRESEWFLSGFDEAVGAPYHGGNKEARGAHAPEMSRGLHGVKVDVWGVGYLVKTCGLNPSSVPKMLRDLQNRCLEHNPEMRPTAADCYHHLLQLQSATVGAPY